MGVNALEVDSLGNSAVTLRRRTLSEYGIRSYLPSSRTALAVLEGFVGLTAVGGAALIVPNLPIDVYWYDGLSSNAIPAIGLGLLAITSVAALYGVLARKAFGASLSILAGAALVIFEFIEGLPVGNVFAPPVGMTQAGYVMLWSQPLYVAVGVAMVLLGGRLPALIRLPSRGIAIALVAVIIGAGCLYGWAAASAQTSMYARLIA